MSRVRLDRADGILLGILGVLAVLAALIAWRFAAPEQRGGGVVDPPSTFHNSRGGAKAAFLVLRELGYRTARLQEPYTQDSLGSLDALMVLQPPLLGDGEAAGKLSDWVRGGGRLVLVPSRAGFSDWFRYAGSSEERAEKGEASAPAVSGDEHGPDQTEGETSRKPLEADDESRTIHVGRDRRKDEPLLQEVRRITTQRRLRFDRARPLAAAGPLAEAEAEPLWSDGPGLAAMRIRHGRGMMIVLGDSHPFTNAALREGDNAVLLANLAAALAGAGQQRPIAFDEYHMGYADLSPQSLAIVKLLTWQGRGWGLVQATLAALAALLAAAVRFGRPRDVPLPERRHETEFVEAAGALLERARAAVVAGRTLREHYRRRLCQLTHLSERADDGTLAGAVREQSGMDIRSALAHSASFAPDTRAEPQRVLHTLQVLYRAVENLEHGTGRDRSHR